MMRRSSLTTQGSKRSLVALLAGVMCLSAGLSARAQVTNYAGSRRQIKACVLVSNASTNVVGVGPQNAAPHLFYVMDRRTDMKPGGWEFVNPLAPSNITGAIRDRWLKRNVNDPAFVNGTPQSALMQVGAPLTKNIGAYWEVNLDNITDDDLRQFDVAFMGFRANSGVIFTPEERERVRRFVEGGGTLWLEDEGSNFNINQNGPFLIDVAFTGNIPANVRAYLASVQHPLVNYPFTISRIEAQGLGAGSGPNRHAHVDPNSGLAAPFIIQPVVWVGNPGAALPYISAGDYGAGHLVVSSAGIAQGVNNYAGGYNVGEGGNTGAVSGENLLSVRSVDLKFAYNLVSYSSSVPTAGSNPHRTTASSETSSKDLARKWANVYNAGAVSNSISGAVVAKGVVFFVDAAGILHAYDANPAQDIDGDNNPDEGLIDYSQGAPYDEIWRATLGGTGLRYSTPTVVSVYNPALGRSQDIVVVSDSTGRTAAFEAFPRNNAGRLVSTPASLWSFANGGTNFSASLNVNGVDVPAPAAAYSEGILFTLAFDSSVNADSPWHIAPLNPVTGLNVFGSNAGIAPFAGNAGGTIEGMPDPIGPLTVGYVRDDATGALDKMVYIPTRPYQTAPAIGIINAVWFSTRNEPLEAVPGDQTGLIYRPRGERARAPWYAPNGGGIASLMPRVYQSIRTNGVITNTTVLGSAQYKIDFQGGSGNREMRITLNSLPVLQSGQTLELTADYTLDWTDAVVGISGGAPTATELRRFTSMRRLPLPSPGPMPEPTIAAGNVTLASDDLIAFNTIWDNTAIPGRVYAVREQYNIGNVSGGRRRRGSQSGAAYAWMWSPYAGGAIGAQSVPPRLVDRDAGYNNVFSAFSGQYVQNFQPVGAPAYSNGVVYSIGKVTLQGQQATLILALRANPTMTFSVGRPIPQNAVQVRVRQLDMLQSTGASERYITLTEGRGFVVDRDSGTITVTNSREDGGDVLNAALPVSVLINVPGSATPDEVTVVNPNTGFGPLDNLQWYMLIPYMTGPGVAVDLANIVPTSGPSLVGDTLYFGTLDGHVASVNIKGGSGGAQLPVFVGSNSRVRKIRTMEDLNGNPVVQPIIHPPLGSANLLAVGTPSGLVALENQLTLIADNNRLLEVDYGVNAVWAMDSTRSLTVAGGGLFDTGNIATNKTGLARPNVAHRTSLSEFVVADTGNNRVLSVDRGGIVSWEIRSFSNDMGFVRPGDPLTLNAPTDIQTFNDGSDDGNAQIRITAPNGDVYSYTGAYYAVHYLIADSGNYRAIELVDAYDLNGNTIVLTGPNGKSARLSKQLIFATRSLSEQNARLRYRTIQQFLDPTSGSAFLIAAVDNVRVGAPDAGAALVGNTANNQEGLGGSIVGVRRYPVPPQKDGDVSFVINSIAFPDGNGGYRQQAINNPTWFKEFEVQVGNGFEARYLLADANGCYVLRPTASNAIVDWALTADDYYFLTGRRLRAASIQKLAQADYDAATNKFYPHYLITNRYTGEDNVPDLFGFTAPRGDIHGEVVEVRSIDYVKLGYKNNPNARLYMPSGSFLARNPNSAIVWMAPNETIPTTPGRIRRSIGSASDSTSTYLLEQPTFSERPF